MDTVSFLRALYATTPGGYVELRAIPHDRASGPVRRVFVKTPPEVMAFAEQYGGRGTRYSVYFGVNKRENEDGTKKSIRRVCALYADVDTVKNGWDTDEVLKSIHAMSGVLRPSACVKSGGGLHLYWFLNAPTTDKMAVEYDNTVLRNVFGGDAVQNVDRILRLPGTYNTKRAKSAKVEVAWCYDFDRVARSEVAAAALRAPKWIAANGKWAHKGLVLKNSRPPTVTPDPTDAWSAYKGNAASRNILKNLNGMWRNEVRYHAPRGYMGIHEAALKHTAYLHIWNTQGMAMSEDRIVEKVMDRIKEIKDRDAPHEDWDMEREAETVRKMYRSWIPKFTAYSNERKRQQAAERLKKRKKADGRSSGLRRHNGSVLRKAGRGKATAA